MTLWVPEQAARRMHDIRERHNRRLIDMMELQKRLDDWNRELKAIDPYLQLVKAKDGAEAVGGLKPGYYAIVRHNPGAPASVETLQHPDGSFKEPDSSLFDQLRRMDCWNDEVRRDQERKLEAAGRAQQRREQREFEERSDEMRTLLKALESPGVAFTDRRWSNSPKGKRGRTR